MEYVYGIIVKLFSGEIQTKQSFIYFVLVFRFPIHYARFTHSVAIPLAGKRPHFHRDFIKVRIEDKTDYDAFLVSLSVDILGLLSSKKCFHTLR